MQEDQRVAERKMTDELELIARQRKEMQVEEERILELIHRDQELLKQHLRTKKS